MPGNEAHTHGSGQSPYRLTGAVGHFSGCAGFLPGIRKDIEKCFARAGELGVMHMVFSPHHGGISSIVRGYSPSSSTPVFLERLPDQIFLCAVVLNDGFCLGQTMPLHSGAVREGIINPTYVGGKCAIASFIPLKDDEFCVTVTFCGRGVNLL